VAIEVGGGVHRPPKPVDPATDALFAAYRQGARELGIAVDWTDVGGGSDANLIAAGGLPVLDGLGVVGGGLHSPDEYALIASLDEHAALAAALMARLTGS
jgi:glutamate carboxypeptidase